MKVCADTLRNHIINQKQLYVQDPSLEKAILFDGKGKVYLRHKGKIIQEARYYNNNIHSLVQAYNDIQPKIITLEEVLQDINKKGYRKVKFSDIYNHKQIFVFEYGFYRLNNIEELSDLKVVENILGNDYLESKCGMQWPLEDAINEQKWQQELGPHKFIAFVVQK